MTGTARDVASAIQALMPASVQVGSQSVSPKTFDTSTGTTDAPAEVYFVLHVRLPAVLERSEGATPHGHEVRVRVTSVGRTPGAARDLASAAESALDRARPVADGWLLGPLLLENVRGPDEDPDVTFTNGARAIYAVSEFVVTASRTA
ncbi:hypothetical protein [Cellulomonas denverensis]|uniref:DUF3168 domain-containing protein n=1 Tax=Cellulomonas denverensis TaxID=264297 RepID=A0A7X6KUU1_9CELL|nr:hypothetical protein [Cellulomonas denverensis]NKY22220.1 hypothetical protein [Cellulomonas denverensis]GIG27186.1 hypothetical protein Cde04nite_34300 [Cellulomonas denverensis]